MRTTRCLWPDRIARVLPGIGIIAGIGLTASPALAGPCDAIKTLEDLTLLIEETKTSLLDGTEEAPAIAARLESALGCLDEVPTAIAAKGFFFIAAEAVSRVDPDNIADRHLRAYLALSDDDLWNSVYGSDLRDRIDAIDPEVQEHGVVMATPLRFPAAPQIYGQGRSPPWTLTPGPVTVESGVWSVQVTLEPKGLVILHPSAFGPKEQKQVDLQITTPVPTLVRKWSISGGVSSSHTSAGSSSPAPGAWAGGGPRISASTFEPLSPRVYVSPTITLDTTVRPVPSAWLRASSADLGVDLSVEFRFGHLNLGPRLRITNSQELSLDEQQLLRGNQRAVGVSMGTLLTQTNLPVDLHPCVAAYSDGDRTYTIISLEGALIGVLE